NSLTFTGPITGSGSLSKQGGGTLTITNSTPGWTGGFQNGNGTVNINSGAYFDGDLGFNDSSNNNPAYNLYNSTQNIKNLYSKFVNTTGGPLTQTLNLNNTNLIINQNTSNSFGYGAANNLTSTITNGSGSTPADNMVTYNGNAGVQLTLTGPNSYSGGTVISGGI